MNHDLYGSGLRITELAPAIESALGITFALHESGFHGGEYFRFTADTDEEFILKNNIDDVEDEWAEPDFKASASLLYVDFTSRAEEVGRALAKVMSLQLLRSEVL
ncbi:hypothetical protein [Tahibacter amnicola]|uniref:Immunity protein 51 of polymorphic toxin system n=1 Tax=Tahibacter amnicola TaxID=2976241 RepID=A0ABY6BGV5_9GAMM|nr:hypothetical protein [Tahibacter amnicola]UXI68548.1 hypothetical protein N4264_02525 [Tahibacter amnicola]